MNNNKNGTDMGETRAKTYMYSFSIRNVLLGPAKRDREDDKASHCGIVVVRSGKVTCKMLAISSTLQVDFTFYVQEMRR